MSLSGIKEVIPIFNKYGEFVHWRAAISLEGIKVYLGKFIDLDNTITARIEAEKKYGVDVQTRNRK